MSSVLPAPSRLRTGGGQPVRRSPGGVLEPFMKSANFPNGGGVVSSGDRSRAGRGGYARVAEREATSVCSEVNQLTAAAPALSIRPALVPSATAVPALPLPPCRLLLVEDHADTGTMMRRLLARRGYQVTLATNCAEAMAAAEAQPFDVILSDLGLPDGSGLDLVGPLSRLTKSPAIALSGYGMPDDARKSTEAGFVVHLTKPVAVERLWATLDRVMASRATPIEA